MPVRDSIPAGAPCWADLATSDITSTRDFYAALFGWTYDDAAAGEYGGYVNALRDGALVAGLSPYSAEMGGVPDVWGLYLKSDDATATADAVAAAGGSVLVPPMHVDPFGHMAVFLDAGQAAIGAWQPQTHQGFGADSLPGAPGWHEVYARDFAARVAFYEQAFGWSIAPMSDSDEFRYSTATIAGGPGAGIMDGSGFLPEGVQSHWMTYWLVDNAEDACATATSHGGTVVDEPQDSPFGRVATLADCCGARFKVITAVAR